MRFIGFIHNMSYMYCQHCEVLWVYDWELHHGRTITHKADRELVWNSIMRCLERDMEMEIYEIENTKREPISFRL